MRTTYKAALAILTVAGLSTLGIAGVNALDTYSAGASPETEEVGTYAPRDERREFLASNSAEKDESPVAAPVEVAPVAAPVTPQETPADTNVYDTPTDTPPTLSEPVQHIFCPSGTIAGAVDDNGNESNCQPLNDQGQQCVEYSDANECVAWLQD